MNKGYDWHCKKHNTFGDNGWSCAKCGYPLGVKNIEFKNRKLKVLRAYINLFFFKITLWKTIQL